MQSFGGKFGCETDADMDVKSGKDSRKKGKRVGGWKMNQSDTIIKIDNLNKSFGDVKAVKDLSFRVKKGELFAFLGVNGAGKSTTISIICGQLQMACRKECHIYQALMELPCSKIICCEVSLRK